ncbi:hypothetical protein NM688_g404 [Phlebia brevispora]|uniref:Uncharacterized protein n=1 Tax=Phlebia brevispora TaxID=194682 RepID=A0ACC1TEL0_9APHY|nr:hypothetical protein NM688_g404 [Phlebia brevispora]
MRRGGGTGRREAAAAGGATGAAVIGAATGEKVMQEQEQKREQKQEKKEAKKEKETHKDDNKTKKESDGKPNTGDRGAYAEDEHAECKANLRRATLTPRAHVLGTPGARWGGIEVGTDGYKHGENVDLDEGGGYDTDYHPADMHPEGAEHSKEHAEAEKAKEPAAEKDSEKPLQGSGHEEQATSQQQKSKKAGFMAKMKGEALTLLGKVEGKKGQEKVEEGQRLKSGQAAATH